MKITKTIFDEGKISLGKVLEGYELKKTEVKPNNTLKDGMYIFEFVRTIDEEKRHILYVERFVDEEGDLFEDPNLERFSDEITFKLFYQVRNEKPNEVFFLKGRLEEGIDDEFEAAMYRLIGENEYADFLEKRNTTFPIQ